MNESVVFIARFLCSFNGMEADVFILLQAIEGDHRELVQNRFIGKLSLLNQGNDLLGGDVYGRQIRASHSFIIEKNLIFYPEHPPLLGGVLIEREISVHSFLIENN